MTTREREIAAKMVELRLAFENAIENGELFQAIEIREEVGILVAKNWEHVCRALVVAAHPLSYGTTPEGEKC